MVELNGSAGTGGKIIGNWNEFRYQLNEEKTDSNYYYFDISFGNQKGTFLIIITDGKIDESTVIDCDFDRPLGAYNDGSLFEVAEKILKESKIEVQ